MMPLLTELFPGWCYQTTKMSALTGFLLAVALHRFGIGGVHSKRQRAGAVQNLAVNRTVIGRSSIVTQMRTIGIELHFGGLAAK
jgi:hypothetical protein